MVADVIEIVKPSAKSLIVHPTDGVRTSAVSDVAVFIYKYQGPGHDIPRLYCKIRSTADCLVSANT